MKRTVIRYKKIDGRIHITGFENAAGEKELIDDVGAVATKAYRQGRPRYLHKPNYGSVVVVSDSLGGNMGSVVHIYEGTKFHPYDFGEVIKAMKAAGDRLGEIRKEIKEVEERKVII